MKMAAFWVVALQHRKRVIFVLATVRTSILTVTRMLLLCCNFVCLKLGTVSVMV